MCGSMTSGTSSCSSPHCRQPHRPLCRYVWLTPLPSPHQSLVQPRDLASQKHEPSPLSSHQILKWPQPQALGETVTKTMVNTVAANPTLTYLTALTDSNIVAIWKRQ